MENNETTKEIKKVTEPKKAKKKNKTLAQKLSTVVLVLIIGALVATASGFLYIRAVMQQAPTLELEKISSKEGTKIFFEDGTFMASLAAFERENITFDDLGHDVVDAFLAIEDARFFSHNGFDLPRFTRAFLNNLRRGDLGEGASTFSMQLVDNAYDSFFSEMIYGPYNEYLKSDGATPGSFTAKVERLKMNIRKINAKILEIGMAIDLEKLISKQQIMENYLNKIYFGAGSTRGIQNAALYFFNKPASDLSLVEAAFLAGVINAPSAYNPWANLAKAKKRTTDVLYQMHYHGYISDQEYKLALKVELEDLLVDPDAIGIFTKGQYITVVNTVIAEAKSLGYDPFNSTMHIYTSVRKDVQDTIEDMEQGKTNVVYPHKLLESAVNAIENNTGRIVGIGGGRKTAMLGYNRATESNFQPGSSIKPVLSYALAFDYLGWSTSHVIEDRPAFYTGTNIVIRNADGNYRGDVTLMRAVAQSYNLPAYLTLVEVQNKLGTKKIREYLTSLGFRDSSVANYNAQYAIGGSNFMVSPLEMTAAHSVLYSGGAYTKPHIIDRIDIEGNESYEASFSKTQVISPEAAYLVSRLTLEAVNNSIGRYMELLKRNHPIFGKTGTSDYGESGKPYGIPVGAAKEKWMVIANSQYTFGIWIGFDKPVKGEGTYLKEEYQRMNITGKMARVILDALEKGQPKATDLKRPSGITSITHILGTYPYAAPVAGMDPKYVAVGLIKKEFATLTSLVDNTIIEPLKEFNVLVNATTPTTQNLAFNFEPYPGKIGLDPTYDLILTQSNGKVAVRTTGNHLFLPSWLYGGIGYKIAIYDDSDQLLQVLNFTEPAGNVVINATPGVTLKVCGYYGYLTGEKKGEEICRTITITDETIHIPNFTSKTQVDDFITTYSLSNWSYENMPAPTINTINTIVGAYRGSLKINNMEIYLSQLNLTTKVRRNVDWQIGLPQDKSFSEVVTWGNNLGATVTSDTLSNSDPVTEYIIAGNSYAPGDLVNLSSLQTFKVS